MNLNLSDSTDLKNFKSLQYALFSTCFVEVIGGLFFLITAFYIVQDKHKVEAAVHEAAQHNHLDHDGHATTEHT
ncbi:protein spinster-like [Anoplophora glabripennis]|uniref:protein spinster-like n=1 Tax=Anoplophora glabripennis TaxID=217634 RepID=UPI0008758C6F|nr:protein spinster-like [Anoplophora glabripennis]